VSSLPKVTVCLATYNGGAYLREQIESLIAQKDIEINIIAGDDGSEDNSVAILNEYFEAGLISRILLFDRIGSTKNFASLLKECPNSDFVAFADQDDIWDEQKLGILISKFFANEPQLVFCGRRILKNKMDTKKMHHTLPKRLGFQNALVESSVPGNTIVLNNHAVSLANQSSIAQVQFFDAYLYLLISALGRVIYVDQPLVQYRIHSKNQVGFGDKKISKKLEGVMNYIRTAEILKSDIGDKISIEKKAILDEFLNAFRNPSLLFSFILILKSRVRRQRRVDGVGWKILGIFARLKQEL
jgi:glycosyltransferase involved in cell wall biosynthesis